MIQSIGWKENVIAGSIAGCSSLAVCHPFDVVRINAQTSNTKLPLYTLIYNIMYINNNNTNKSIIRGISSLYKGFWGPFFAQGLYKSIIFSTNSLMGQYCYNNQKPTSLSIFISGFVAGTVNCIVVSPVELIRTKQVISQSDKSISSIFTIVNNIIFQSGIKSLYRNLTPSILRDGPGVGLYFLTFNQSKLILSNAMTSNQHNQPLPPTTSFFIKLLSGSFAGVAFWLWAFPVDTIKTVMESSNNSSPNMYQTTLKLMKDGGIGRLYRGWSIAIARGIPSAAVTLTTYDYCIDFLTK